MNVFLDAADRRVFLRMLRETSELYSLIHHSYSLMTNHTHFISTPKQPSSLYLTMRDLFGSCASYFNHKHGLSGRLWQGRFYSTVLDETHFWAAIRYVERNPVRAGMVLRAEEYEWSAAPAHCGLRHDPILVPLATIPDFISSWSSWLSDEEDRHVLKVIRTTTKTGHPCGLILRQEIGKRVGRPHRWRHDLPKKIRTEGQQEHPRARVVLASPVPAAGAGRFL